MLRAQQRVQLAAEAGILTLDFVALRDQILVVELFDLGRQFEDGLTAGQDFAPKERGAVVDLFCDGPVEERLESLPVRMEIGFEAADAGFVFAAPLGDLVQFPERRPVAFSKLRQLRTVFRRALANGVEQIIADEDARQVNVGPQRLQLAFDFPMVCVQLVKLDVDLLRPVERGDDGEHDNQQQPGQPDRSHGPCLEPHWSDPTGQPDFRLSMTSGKRGRQTSVSGI